MAAPLVATSRVSNDLDVLILLGGFLSLNIFLHIWYNVYESSELQVGFSLRFFKDSSKKGYKVIDVDSFSRREVLR